MYKYIEVKKYLKNFLLTGEIQTRVAQFTFDIVDHVKLSHKLCGYGFEDIALQWIRLYLTDRSQMCTVEDSVSESKAVNFGIP